MGAIRRTARIATAPVRLPFKAVVGSVRLGGRAVVGSVRLPGRTVRGTGRAVRATARGAGRITRGVGRGIRAAPLKVVTLPVSATVGTFRIMGRATRAGYEHVLVPVGTRVGATIKFAGKDVLWPLSVETGKLGRDAGKAVVTRLWDISKRPGGTAGIIAGSLFLFPGTTLGLLFSPVGLALIAGYGVSKAGPRVVGEIKSRSSAKQFASNLKNEQRLNGYQIGLAKIAGDPFLVTRNMHTGEVNFEKFEPSGTTMEEVLSRIQKAPAEGQPGSAEQEHDASETGMPDFTGA